ncbi:MAG: ATP-binding protein [Chloroflexi bacterium]|nr:ATP-binding protein [Chloroflexota bacterium]
MLSPITERLNVARRQRFVGRESEKSLFESALTAGELPFQVLYVHGPGGIGKTTLLREFAELAKASKVHAYYVDTRSLEPSPESFLMALQFSMAIPPTDSPAEYLAARPGRHIILIDTYETLGPLDTWLRERFLPSLTADTLVVIASRNPPEAAWRSDPGWAAALKVWPLRNLSPTASREYLIKRDIPSTEYPAVLDFTHGHPLALSLVADVFAQRPGFHFQPEQAPDMVKVLLERFVQKVPSPAHRAALESCALVRVMTESLLGNMLRPSSESITTIADDGTHDLFNWLRSLSFIELSREGLFPHDLAREALLADLRWRNPDWYKELHNRARNYYTTRFQQTHGLEQQRTLYDYVFLHRDNPVIRSMLEWQSGSLIVPDAMRQPDRPICIEMVKKHEGTASAKLADKWLNRQPEGVTVYRDLDGHVVGFIAMVALDLASEEDIQSDPATRLASDYLHRHAPLRTGELATHYRFWMARETYQDVSSVQTLIFLNFVRYQLATPGLAYHFLPCANPDTWAAAFAYANFTRVPEIDYTVDGKRFGVYGHDWRTEPPLAWLQLLAEREVAGGTPATPPSQPAQPIVVLCQEDFTTAVRDALHDFPMVDALRKNPLVQSRIVTQRVSGTASMNDRACALQSVLKENAEALKATPRDAKLARALEQTYFQPAATQEQAAEKLDLPFSTYRRHLKEGIERITEMLWQQEIGR